MQVMKLHIELSVTCTVIAVKFSIFFIIPVELACVALLQLVQELVTHVPGKIFLISMLIE